MLEFMNKDSISWILISACLAFISGQVWNSIRGPQYLMRARGSYNEQFIERNEFYRWWYRIYIPFLSTSTDCWDPHCSNSIWNDDRRCDFHGQRRRKGRSSGTETAYFDWRRHACSWLRTYAERFQAQISRLPLFILSRIILLTLFSSQISPQNQRSWDKKNQNFRSEDFGKWDCSLQN